MVLPLFVLAIIAASMLLHSWLRRSTGRKTYWSTVLGIALGISMLRVGAVAIGIWILGRDSGWWQIPAYGMTLLGFPEGAFLRRPWDVSPAFLVQLGMFVAAGTTLWVGAIALLADRRR